MRTDHWNKRALDFVRPHFDQAQHLAQIATGFFTVQGFDLVRGPLAYMRKVNQEKFAIRDSRIFLIFV